MGIGTAVKNTAASVWDATGNAIGNVIDTYGPRTGDTTPQGGLKDPSSASPSKDFSRNNNNKDPMPELPPPSGQPEKSTHELLYPEQYAPKPPPAPEVGPIEQFANNVKKKWGEIIDTLRYGTPPAPLEAVPSGTVTV
ncbi:MAG: hypothetical protein Q7R90_00220, partial [bacterium]|nr:hypothetical protein [bacterium]